MTTSLTKLNRTLNTSTKRKTGHKVKDPITMYQNMIGRFSIMLTKATTVEQLPTISHAIIYHEHFLQYSLPYKKTTLEAVLELHISLDGKATTSPQSKTRDVF